MESSRGRNADVNNKERSRRSSRNKRYNRRNLEEKRPPKRLFTPEIKRFLKDWLIRRRDNPYPSRDEKKSLAFQTGLTYIQVCNWFANWRRKLKNSGKESLRKSWGYLIKTYNNQIHGNVEHFSICSEDSIWQEFDKNSDGLNLNNNNHHRFAHEEITCFNPFAQNNKYQLVQKYLDNFDPSSPECEKSSMINKWLESAEKFKPEENNYLNWIFSKSQKSHSKKVVKIDEFQGQHGKAEMDAAEALTRLATNTQNSLKL